MKHTPHQRAKAKAATHTHAPGDRVFDSLTAQEGTVERSTLHHAILPAAAAAGSSAAPGGVILPTPQTVERLHIQLEDGSQVTRTPLDVIAIPAGLVDLASWGG